MTSLPDDVVKVASGSLVEVELWQSALKDANVDSRVVGNELTGGLGTALPLTIELWVHRSDFDKAVAAIKYAQEHAAGRHPSAEHAIPESERLPNPPDVERKRTHPNPF